MRYFLLTIALLAFLTVQAQAGFPKSQNFMSKYGYDRWQYFLSTGIWAPYER